MDELYNAPEAPPVEQPPINLYDTEANAPMTDRTAQTRAVKTSYGSNKDLVQAKDAITTGDEKALRDLIASENSTKNSQERTQAMIDTYKITPAETIGWKQWDMLKPWPDAPDSVIEDNYAKLYIDHMDKFGLKDFGTNFWKEAQQYFPQDVQKAKQQGYTFTRKLGYIDKAIDDNRDVLEQQGLLKRAKDIVFSMLPFYNHWNLRGLDPDTGTFDGITIDENLKRQGDSILAEQDPEKFKRRLDIAIAPLKDYPLLLGKFLKSIRGETYQDKAENLTGDLIDASMLPGILRGVSSGVKATKRSVELKQLIDELPKKLEESIKAEMPNERPEVAIPAANGDLRTAAVNTVSRRLADKATLDETREGVESLPLALRGDASVMRENPGNGGMALSNMIAEKIEAAADKTLEVLMTTKRVDRLRALPEIAAFVDKQVDKIRQYYPGLDNSFINASVAESISREPLSNIYRVHAYYGDFGAEFFKSEAAAKQFIEFHPFIKHVADVVPTGPQTWGVRVTRSLKEDEHIVRDFLSDSATGKSVIEDASVPKGRLDKVSPDLAAVLSYARTADETMSINQRVNRSIASYAQTNFKQAATDLLKPLQELKSWKGMATHPKQWFDLHRVIKNTFNKLNENGEPGFFFNTVPDLQDYYMKNLKRLASDREVGGYFAWKTGVEMDRVFRNLMERRFRGRWGAENHRIWTTDNTVFQGEMKHSQWFDGRQMNELPGGFDKILIVGEETGQERIMASQSPEFRKQRQFFEGLMKQGRIKVLELYQPELRQFSTFSKYAADQNARIRYVITPNLETRPLQWDYVTRQQGGHFMNEYPWWVSQANMHHEKAGGHYWHWYEGEANFSAFNHRADADKIAAHMEPIRELMHAKKYADAEAYVNAHIPAIGWDRIHKSFMPRFDENGIKHPPVFNTTEKFTVRPAGKKLVDLDRSLEDKWNMSPGYNNKKGEWFRDGTKEGSAGQNFQVPYNVQRQANEFYALKNVGTSKNPVWEYVPAEMVDPMVALDRGLNQAANALQMDDYKIFAVEDWLARARQYMKADETRIRNAPFHYFNDKDPWKPGADKAVIRSLEADRFKINQLIGVPSKFDNFFTNAAQRMADSLYEKSSTLHTAGILPLWALSHIPDAPRVLKSLVFNTKVGLFPWTQWWSQNQSFMNIYGLSPQFAAKGSAGGVAHQFSRFNSTPEFLKHLDSKMVDMGWRPGEWTAAREAALNVGAFNVGGTHYQLERQLHGKLLRGLWGQIEHAGQTPFREGELNVRHAAWYTAYKEVADGSKNVILTEKELDQVFLRFRDMMGNMDRAANSILQGNWAGPMTQFLTYNQHLVETMTGKRITNMERMRLFGIYGAMFGVPGATGLFGFPLPDTIRRQMIINYGYVPGDNLALTIPMEGMIATTFAALSAGPSNYFNPAKGTWYDFNEKYGMSGLGVVREALYESKDFWHIFGGPSLSMAEELWRDKDPFVAMARSFIRQDGKYFTPTMKDLTEVFQELNAVKDINRARVALGTGNWISKHGQVMETDVSAVDAMFRTIFGVQPSINNDSQILRQAMQQDKETMTTVEKIYTRYIHRALLDAQNNDQSSFDRNMTQAGLFLEITQYPEDQRTNAFKRAIEGKEGLIARMQFDWAHSKNVNDEEAMKRYQTYEKIQNVKGNK